MTTPAAASVYTPRHSAGSSLVSNTLYIVAGTISVAPPFLSTAEILAVSLDAPFSTNSIPWRRLQSGYFVRDARVTTTPAQKHLVLAGVGDQVGQLVVVYDIASNSWSYLPATAAANVQPQTPRTSVGMALDPKTGQIVMFGGLLATGGTNGSLGTGSRTISLSLEFDILDVRPSLLEKWVWSATIRSTGQLEQPTGLVEPILLYLPSRQVTLIIGGCGGVSAIDGSVTQCVAFSTGYLVSSMIVTTTNGSTSQPSIPISTVALTGPSLPPARSSPCTAVLANGDVFMYGGAAANGSLGDAWVLKTKDWTWVRRSIANMPFPGRAGGTCQLLAEDQLIVVGGFDGGLTGPRQFSNPQVAVINTTSWAWTTNFTPTTAPSPLPGGTDNSKLSTGVIIGVIAGCCVILGIMFAVLGRMFWIWRQGKRYRENAKEKGPNKIFRSDRASYSTEPLMDTNDTLANGSDFESTPMVAFATFDQGSQYHRIHSSTSRDDTNSRAGLYNKSSREPFLVVPYPPPALSSEDLTSTILFTTLTMNSTMNFSTKSQYDATVANSIPLWTTDLSSSSFKRERRALRKTPLSVSTSSDLLIGDRLPQTEADVQHSHYVRTLQHHKQYEMRREQEQRRNPGLSRSGTQHTIEDGDHGGPCEQDEDEKLDLATGVIALRDIDLGEEPVPVSEDGLDGVEDGTILLSSHLDTSKLDTSLLHSD